MKNFDDVNGEIIGGDYGQCWVTYEGRKQGNICYPSNEKEAYEMCESIIQRFKDECKDEFTFNMIYPNKEGWKFHFDGI